MTMTSPQIAAGLARWHECVANSEMTALDELLADNVVFRSPFLWKPKGGREVLKIVLSTAAQVFQDFTYHRELSDGTSYALEFSARVGEFSLKGVDLIRFNADG